MMFAASATSVWWVVIGRMIIRVVATCISRMTATGMIIIGCDRPNPAGRPCYERRSISALGIEARSADRIHGRCTRMPAISGCELVAVQAGGMVMVELLASRLDMVLVHGRLFLRRGLGLNACAAVEARVIIHDRIVDNRIVDIGVVNYCGIDTHHGGIVAEVSAMPFPAYKS